MSIIPKISNYLEEFNVDVSQKEYSIGGKLVTATYTGTYIDKIAWQPDYENMVKERLAEELVRYMMENNLIEFTKQLDPNTDNTLYRAHVYVAPNNQIKILRISVK